MKQIRRRIPSTLYSFPLLLFIFVLVVIGSDLLALSGLEGVFKATLFNTPQGILLLVVGPLALIVFLALLLFGIMSDSFRHNSSNRRGNRIFLSFCFVILCATVPQTVIVGQFVSTALGTWFDSSVTESLAAANDIAELYVTERNRIVSSVAEKFLNGLSIENYRSRPVDWMTTIRSMDPEASACQVYLLVEDGKDGPDVYTPIIETGDSGKFVPRNRLDTVRDGQFSLDSDIDTLRYGQTVRYGKNTYVCAYTSLIPAGFSGRLEVIRSAVDQSRVIDTLDPYLPFMGVWIFMMFCLPSVLMVIILAFYLSSTLADPLCAMQEAAERLASGDASFRLVTHTGDELAETARIINSLADESMKGKKPDKKAVLRL